MDISELWVIYSPHYEGTNNLIKWRFRLNRMVYRAWAQERMPLNSHWLGTYIRTKALISDFHDCWFVDSM